MPEEIRPSDDRIEHPDVHREETDASFAAILFLLLGAIVVAFFIYVGVTVFLYDWRDHESTVKASPFPLAPAPSTDPRQPPPLPTGQPRLEQEDRLAGIEGPNVYDRQKAKEDALNSYDLKEKNGFVHIPIEEAMKSLADKLPHRAAPPYDQVRRADGLIDAGEPNSGREFRGKRK